MSTSNIYFPSLITKIPPPLFIYEQNIVYYMSSSPDTNTMYSNNSILSRTCVIEEDYGYVPCPNCNAHIYGADLVCGLCDIDNSNPDDLNSDVEFQIEYHNGNNSTNFENVENLVSDPNAYR